MERYIIPFDFDGKSYYVFIDKDEARQVYLVGKILPSAESSSLREIPFDKMVGSDLLHVKPDSFESAICITLFRFLHARGWLALSN